MKIYILLSDCDGTTFSRATPDRITFDIKEAAEWKSTKHGYGYGEVQEFELSQKQREFLQKELCK